MSRLPFAELPWEINGIILELHKSQWILDNTQKWQQEHKASFALVLANFKEVYGKMGETLDVNAFTNHSQDKKRHLGLAEGVDWDNWDDEWDWRMWEIPDQLSYMFHRDAKIWFLGMPKMEYE